MGPPPRTTTTDDDINTIKYDLQTQDFYLCEKCQTHVTLQTQLLNKFADTENNKHYLLFENLINVVPDNDRFISNKKTTVSSTYCTKCSADFGFRFIALEEPKDEIQEGRFIVFAEKFLLCKGKKLLDAVTEQPVDKHLDGMIEANEESLKKRRIAELTEKLHEKKLQHSRLIQQLEVISEVIKSQAEKALLDGVTEEPVEKNMPEAATEDPVDQNEMNG